MAHPDFTALVEDHAEDFDAADEALTQAAIGILDGSITPAGGEIQMDAILDELRTQSTEWVLSVLPAVAADAQETVDQNLGSVGLPADDSVEQAAALELSSLELIETLHNTADQMGRDARRQVREGLRIKMEEELTNE